MCTSKDRPNQLLEEVLQEQGAIYLVSAKQTWLLASRSCWNDNAPVIQLGHKVVLQIRWFRACHTLLQVMIAAH